MHIDVCDPVLDFAARLELAEGSVARVAALEQAVAGYGVSCFAYLNAGQRMGPVHLETTYPDAWIAQYVANGYQHVDPVTLTARRTILPFRWRSLIDGDEGPGARRVFAEAETFGLADGLSVPIHGLDGFAMMSLAVADAALFSAAGQAARHAVQLMAFHYHAAVEREGAARPTAANPLTAREREVLLWAARGKTAWEIGAILRVAERTVVFHIENAKRKLGVGSRSHAIATAVARRLISP